MLAMRVARPRRAGRPAQAFRHSTTSARRGSIAIGAMTSKHSAEESELIRHSSPVPCRHQTGRPPPDPQPRFRRRLLCPRRSGFRISRRGAGARHGDEGRRTGRRALIPALRVLRDLHDHQPGNHRDPDRSAHAGACQQARAGRSRNLRAATATWPWPALRHDADACRGRHRRMSRMAAFGVNATAVRLRRPSRCSRAGARTEALFAQAAGGWRRCAGRADVLRPCLGRLPPPSVSGYWPTLPAVEAAARAIWRAINWRYSPMTTKQRICLTRERRALRAGSRTAPDPGRFPAPRTAPGRHACRLRARHLRRVHDPDRR
jgi:hypothetical protein